MAERKKSKKTPTVAAIGCSGKIGTVFVAGFLEAGIAVNLLSRNPRRATMQHPGAQVVKGSMMNVDEVVHTMENADAAFLITPIGSRNNASIEVNAARISIEAARRVNLPHLIFVSVIGIDHTTGVPLLDSKRTVEIMLANSGIPWTSIRCGTYMEDVIDKRVAALRHGLFIFPVSRMCEFNLTFQGDVPRLVNVLLREKRILNGTLDFIDPHTYTVSEVAQLMTKAAGRRVVASGKWPLYILLLLWPVLYLRKHRLSTIIPLILYFNQHGYTGNVRQMAETFHDFKMTTLDEHLHHLLA